MSDIYARIKQLRIEKDMTQDELANLVGYSDRTAIAHIEAGKRNITQSKIVAFANALGTTPAYLMDGEDTPSIITQTDYQLFSSMFGQNKADVMEMVKNMDADQVERTLQMIKVMFPNIKGGDEK